jgi:hypothetical protein
VKAKLYRDGEYGALGVYAEDRDVIIHNHGFNRDDFKAVSEALSGYAGNRSGPVWSVGGASKVVFRRIDTLLRERGYSDDPLGEKAVMEVSEAQAARPDLPTDGRRTHVNEAVERGMRDRIAEAVRKLGRSGDCTVADVGFFPRPHATNGIGRPLPFARARALLRNPVESASDVQVALREHLSDADVVRATVAEAGEAKAYAVEFAIAPTREVYERYLETAIPNFKVPAPGGVRAVKFYLGTTIDEQDRQRLRGTMRHLGREATVSIPDPRIFVVRVPSGMVAESLSDMAFQERLDWVRRQLKPWHPNDVEVGSVERAIRSRV